MTVLVDNHPIWLPAVVVLGIVVGLLAGLFGVGGGFLLTPTLNVAFGLPPRLAVGTGLCLIIGTSLPALLQRLRQGLGELRVDALMLAGSVLGVEAGGRALEALAAAGTIEVAGRALPLATLVIQTIYAVLLAGAAALFWCQGGAGNGERLAQARRGPLARLPLAPRLDLPAAGLRAVPVLPIAYLGLVIGCLAGLLGIGGGIAMIPLLTYGLGMPLRHAAGTGVLVLVCSSAWGTMTHALRGHVHLGLAAALLAGASLSAYAGALASRRLSPRPLRRLFAVVLLLAVAGLVAKVLHDIRG
jgi:uncharacterized protein